MFFIFILITNIYPTSISGEPHPHSKSKAVHFNKKSHYPQKDPILLEIIHKELIDIYTSTVESKNVSRSHEPVGVRENLCIDENTQI